MKDNYDTEELNHFTSLASRWWDNAGPLKTLHLINPIRFSYIKEKLDLKGKIIIDVGCGGGILSESLAKEGAIVTGIEMSDEVLEVARLHQLESKLKIEYLNTSVEQLAQERPHQFDVVICMEMLEHVPDPLSVVKACSSLAKPGAHLFFSTINRNPKAYLLAILAAEYFLKLLPRGTHDYAKFIRPAELNAWLRQTGLQAKNMSGISYSPLTCQFKLNNDISVNYLLHALK